MWRASAAAAPVRPPSSQPAAPPPPAKDPPAEVPSQTEQAEATTSGQAANAAAAAAAPTTGAAPDTADANNKDATTKKERKQFDEEKLAKALQELDGDDTPPKTKKQPSSGFLSGWWQESPAVRLERASKDLRVAARRAEIEIRRLQNEEERQWDSLQEAHNDRVPAPRLTSMAEALAATRARLKAERARLSRMQKQQNGVSSIYETKLQMDVMRASADALAEHMQNNDIDSVMDLANEFNSQQMAQMAVRDAAEMANDDDGDNDNDETVSAAAQRILDSLRVEDDLDYLPEVPYRAPGSLEADRRLAERYGSS